MGKRWSATELPVTPHRSDPRVEPRDASSAPSESGTRPRATWPGGLLERAARVSVPPAGLDARMKTALRALATGLVLDDVAGSLSQLAPTADSVLVDVLERLAATLIDRASVAPPALVETIDVAPSSTRERSLEAEERATEQRLMRCRVALEHASGAELEQQRRTLVAETERLSAILRERRQTLDGLHRQSRTARQRATRLSAALADAHNAASTDPLTGLGNRRALDRAVEGLGVRDTSVALLMIDLDHFKSINDTHGHSVGDRVLLHVAETLSAALRGDDMGFRIGGEEFLVLLFDCDVEGAQRTAERLRLRIEQRPLALATGTLSVTASLGVSAWNPAQRTGPGSFSHALERADDALYQAKREGRNRWVLREA